MVSLPFKTAPTSICIIRFSAIGDICHVLPIINSIKAQWPNTKITWIIGKVEYQLVKQIKNIEFIIFDKAHNIQSYVRISKQLNQRKFDVLLMMQAALRASILSTLIKADIKIGFDKERSRDAQWFFSNKQINGNPRVHVIDTFYQFISALGISNTDKKWSLPLSEQDMQFAQLKKAEDAVVINPNSSVSRRNWTVDGYVETINYLVNDLNKTVILCASPSPSELAFNQQITELCTSNIIDLSGKTTLGELAAVIKLATLVIAPDTGPAHIATAVNTPVVSLFADTNPNRARPYLCADKAVNCYPLALKHYHNTTEDNVTWGFRIRQDEVMSLITFEPVKKMIDAFFLNSIN